MIFQHTWEKVLSGEKTATSRIVKLCDIGQMNSIGGADMEPGEGIYAVMDHNTSRTIYAVGQDYAVQPGHGQKAVGRIRITSIERYDVRTITEARARAEGYSDPLEFLGTWVSMHDKTYWARRSSEFVYRKDGIRSDIMYRLSQRQTGYYDAWFLTFTLLEGQS